MPDKGLYIPKGLVRDWQLGPGQKIVYAVMLASADDDGICRLSANCIGRLCGMTNSAAQENRMKLCRVGYVKRLPDTQRDYRLFKYLEDRRHG